MHRLRLHAGHDVRGDARVGASDRVQDAVAERRASAGSPACCPSTTAPFTATITAGITASRRSPGSDPELEDAKPTGSVGYAVELSGIPWWIGKLKTHFQIARGRVGRLRVPERQDAAGGRAVGALAALRLRRWRSALRSRCGQPLFVTYWLLPVALGQPLLRAILLAEHTGCSEDDDALSNTRTTHTILPVRFLMWEMPFHAEHHRYPALPFFALARAHHERWARTSRTSRSAATWACTSPSLRGLSARGASN